VIGTFTGTITFGATTLTSAGGADFFVAKLSAQGAWVWAASAGGPTGDYAYGVATTSDGGAVITGSYWGSATFGATTLTSAGTTDGFAAKVSSSGSWVWVKTLGAVGVSGGPASGTLYDLAVMPSGDIMVTGGFQGRVTLGPDVLTSTQSYGILAAKMNSSGTWLRGVVAAGWSLNTGYSISLTGDGGAMVVGEVVGTTTFATTSGSVSHVAADYDPFVAKVNSSMSWEWAAFGDGAGMDYAHAVAATPDGGAIVVGSYNGAQNGPVGGTVTFGSTGTLTSLGTHEIFVAKVSSTGTWTWAVTAGNTGFDMANSVVAMSDGGAIVGGYFTTSAVFGSTTLSTSNTWSDAFVARINSSGTWTWATKSGTVGGETIAKLVPTSDGKILMTGTFNNPGTFGPASLTTAGYEDVVVAKMTTAGAWVTQPGFPAAVVLTLTDSSGSIPVAVNLTLSG
jgi:hypothetical protein